MKADALVVWSPTFLGLPSAFTKAFMERLYAFRRVNMLMKGELGAAVAVGYTAEDDVEVWLGNILGFSKFDVAGTMSAKGNSVLLRLRSWRDLRVCRLERLIVMRYREETTA
jgi:multimeric flavodoxin WrbA